MATERKRARDRRSISTSRPRSYSQMYKKDAVGASPQPVAPTPVAATAAETVDWTHEYAYVAHDLRRLGIVSAILLALIIVVCLIAIQAVGTNTSTTFQNVANSLGS